MNLIVYSTRNDLQTVMELGKVIRASKDRVVIIIGNDTYEAHSVNLLRGLKPRKIILLEDYDCDSVEILKTFAKEVYLLLPGGKIMKRVK